ncbi:MAG: class I SAM-dependent methyltransferase [Candidatus Woesearchaeota archaeon]
MNLADFQRQKYARYVAVSPSKFYLHKVFDLIAALPRKSIKDSLELGCADGSFSVSLEDAFGLQMYGLDISRDAVRSARKKGIVAFQHDLEKSFPMAKHSFDLVVACEVVEHLFDTDFFLSEVRRVLRPGGFLVLSTPNLASLKNRLRLLLGKYPELVPEFRPATGHVSAYTADTLCHQLDEQGFEVLELVAPNFPFPMTSRFVPRFLKRAASALGNVVPSWCSHLIVVARVRKHRV